MAHPAPQNVRADLMPGSIIVQKYRVERVLGRGGMGIVVEARHLALDERVAMKFLHPEVAILSDAITRFMREARAVIRIKSEHVARVMDVATLETGEPFMVMEFLDGCDLFQKIKKDGPLPIHDALDYIIQACDALAEAHQLGIVHRDIKPSNLFLTRGTDGASVVKVLDFGISKIAHVEGIDPLTRTAMTMGSAQYMSPEQMKSMRDVDLRTDVYSLGATLYKLLTGRAPFDGASMPAVFAQILAGEAPPLRFVRADVPEALARAIEKAYARDPAGRYPSVAELVFALSPHAGPASRATIERIARLAARPGTAGAVAPGAPMPGPWSAKPSQPQAATQLLPETAAVTDEAPTNEIVPSESTEPIEVPVRRGSRGVVVALVVVVVAAGGAGLWWRTRTPPAAEAPAPATEAPAMEAIATPPSSAPPDPVATVAPSGDPEPAPPTTAVSVADAGAPVVAGPLPAIPQRPVGLPPSFGAMRPIATAAAATATPAPPPPPQPTTPKPSAFDTR